MSTSYTSPYPGGWVNDPAGGSRRPGDTPLDADAVTVLDQGIGLAHDRIDSVNSSISGAVVAANQATATVAAQTSLPSYGPSGLLHGYDARRCVYNAKVDNTRRGAAGLAYARTALTRELVIGDSLPAGCTDNGADPGHTLTFDRLHAWPMVYRDTVALRLGVPVSGTGMVRCTDSVGIDTRWAYSSGWTPFTTEVYATASGATATFTSDKPGTCAAVGYLGTDPFTITIDAGSPVAITPPAGVSTPQRAVLTGLANTVHAVKVTTTTASIFALQAAEVYQPVGLVVDNMAQSGSCAAGFGQTAWSDTTAPQNLLPTLGPGSGIYGQAPSRVHICLGTNDLSLGATPAQITAALTVIAGACTTVGADVVLYLEPQANETSIPTWTAYASAMYQLADTLDVPLVDIQALLGGYAIEAALGLAGDTVAHLTAPAYAMWGAAAGAAV